MKISGIIETEKDEGKETHIPDIQLDKEDKSGSAMAGVILGHGATHPNTVDHHIVWIELYGVRKDGSQV